MGLRLRRRRKLLGYTQVQLADAVNVRPQQIQKYESGINKLSAARLNRLAHELRIPIEYFFDGWAEDEESKGYPTKQEIERFGKIFALAEQIFDLPEPDCEIVRRCVETIRAGKHGEAT